MHLYIHIPFCHSRCTYCDFNTYTGLDSLIPAYVDALCAEINHAAAWCSHTNPELLTIETIFFGGGTPSVLPLPRLQQLTQTLSSAFTFSDDLEWSLEANPGTLTELALGEMRSCGINRLSFGVQSSHQDELDLLGRIHTYPEAVQAIQAARRAGFDNVNVDLIYGLPLQSLNAWKTTLSRAVDLGPEHLSLYALTLEEETPLWSQVQNGSLPTPDEDLAADMYLHAEDALSLCGYAHYEISNWARSIPSAAATDTFPSNACRHNLNTWHNHPYLGLGAGAHGSIPRTRYANIRHPGDYIVRMQADNTSLQASLPSMAAEESWAISAQQEMTETMILGLRLLEEGVTFQDFEQRFGESLLSRFGDAVSTYQQLDLLEVTPERVRLTTRGHLLANQVMQAFLLD